LRFYVVFADLIITIIIISIIIIIITVIIIIIIVIKIILIGEKIGLYFVYLGRYTTWLFFAAVAGVGFWINVAYKSEGFKAPS
jgi:hypothetical protein